MITPSHPSREVRRQQERRMNNIQAIVLSALLGVLIWGAALDWMFDDAAQVEATE